MSSTSRCSVAAVCAFIGVPSLPGGNFLPGSKPFAPDRGPGVLLYTRFLGLLQESSHFRGTPTGVPADSPSFRRHFREPAGSLSTPVSEQKAASTALFSPLFGPVSPLFGPPCST